jgi:hypothetical protein
MIIEREIYKEIKAVVDSPEAVVITGMRRVGKTTLLRYIMERIESKNKVFLDLENPANRKYFEEENYEKIFDNLRFLGLSSEGKGYVFLDEAQFVKNLPSVVKYLLDHHGIKFFVSGSSSFYLKNLFSESLSGRKYIFELYPLCFKEFLAIRNSDVKIPEEMTSAVFDELSRYYDEYILYGGFPGVVQKENIAEKKMMLQDIFSAYFQLEIAQLSEFKKPNVVRDLILLLIERTGSRIDVQKLSKELGVARQTVAGYLSFLEDTYFISLVRPFSKNRDSEIRVASKFYLCDTGLINEFSKMPEGRLFENAVFLALRQKGEVNYFQRKSGVEIDFIFQKRKAYEVKTSAREEDVKKLKTLSEDIGINEYSIISRRYSLLSHVIFAMNL